MGGERLRPQRAGGKVDLATPEFQYASARAIDAGNSVVAGCAEDDVLGEQAVAESGWSVATVLVAAQISTIFALIVLAIGVLWIGFMVRIYLGIRKRKASP